jgi:hypothetical protein
MPVKFLPDKLLKKIAPKKKIKRLLKVDDADARLKKSALSFIDDVDFIDKKKVQDVALNVINSYKKRLAKEFNNEGLEAVGELGDEILDDPKLLINRIENEVIFQVHQGIQEKYGGQKARWLPSDAEEPRPEHQLNYGKTYVIGEGIDGVEPGDEYGCKCGVEILNEDELLLD